MFEEEKKKILIIDDDQALVMALTTFFKRHGYKMSAAYDAVYGMGFSRKEKVDLVILDLGLPAGGGVSVLENLKRLPQTQDIPVVILTAKTEEGLEKAMREKGAAAFFTKPVEPERMLRKIQEILQ
jgi:two-component system phosphate regulon response regulator PhoB